MPRIKTKEDFIEKAKAKHNSKYDYSKVNYQNTKEKVEIICPIHGSFYQKANNHLNGQGCPECGKSARATSQRYTSNEFIESVKKIHWDKYDYSQVHYVNSQTKVKIICPVHGEFLIKPNSHYNGQGCPSCGRLSAQKNITLDYNVFLERAEKTHGNKYEYLESSYKNYTTKMTIHCSEHGFFEQTPHSHISMKAGCPKCGLIKTGLSNKKNWELVYDMFKTVHGNRYEYDSNSYIKVTEKMRIFCSKHGWFEQKPYQHYGGSGCNKCAIEELHNKQKIDFDEFVKRSNSIHGNRYSYAKDDFTDIFTPTHIVCIKHGEFYQMPRDHYRGAGCPKCISSRGENEIRKILQELNLNFEEQKKFEDLSHKSKLKCDFYISEYNAVIEYNGLQHYEPISVFGGIEGLRQTQKRDLIKYEYLNSKGINLIIVRYDIDDINNYLLEKFKVAKQSS